MFLNQNIIIPEHNEFHQCNIRFRARMIFFFAFTFARNIGFHFLFTCSYTYTPDIGYTDGEDTFEQIFSQKRKATSCMIFATFPFQNLKVIIKGSKLIRIILVRNNLEVRKGHYKISTIIKLIK